MAAQVAHAAVNCSLKSKKSDSSNFKKWYSEGQKKVVVKGNVMAYSTSSHNRY